jgi:hypothetical protein
MVNALSLAWDTLGGGGNFKGWGLVKGHWGMPLEGARGQGPIPSSSSLLLVYPRWAATSSPCSRHDTLPHHSLKAMEPTHHGRNLQTKPWCFLDWLISGICHSNEKLTQIIHLYCSHFVSEKGFTELIGLRRKQEWDLKATSIQLPSLHQDNCSLWHPIDEANSVATYTSLTPARQLHMKGF